MAQYINKDALVAEIERLHKEHTSKEYSDEAALVLEELEDFLDTIEVKEVDNTPNIRFPHYKSIVEKVFGAGNLESFEHDEAEQLVSLAKEELLKDLEVKEVNLEGLVKDFCYEYDDRKEKWYELCPNDRKLLCNPTWANFAMSIAKHFFELGLRVNQENNVISTLEREVKIDAGGYPCIDCYIEFYDYDKDIPLAKEGDKVKIIVMKGK